MRRWLLLLMAVSVFAVVAACGDDDDDDGGDELTEEEYFTRMDEIDKELDGLFEAEGETAGEVADQFEIAIDTAQERYGDVNPPSDLEDEHDSLVEGVNNFDEAIASAAEDIDDDAEPDAYFEVFGDEDVSAADEQITAAFCAIQDAADEAGIEADVGCDDEGEDGDGEDPASLPPEETTENEIIEFVFTPPHMQVSVGDTVTWTNQDEAPHTATADDGSFDTGTLSQGDTGDVTFEEAGTFTYFCEIHPDMLGAVTVVE